MKQILLLGVFALFSLTIQAQAPNDDCADREIITVTTTEILEYTTDTSLATESINASCEFENFENLDVWYEFAMPVTGNLRVTGIPSNVGITIFDTCGGSELTCFFNDSFAYNLIAGTNYVLRLSESSANPGPVTFGLQAFETIANDECADRETITVTTTEVLEYTLNTAQASESMNTSCEFESIDNLDAWYEFVMPVTGNLRVTEIPSNIGITLFDSCGGSELACFFNDGFAYGLVGGTTYVLRVSESQTSAGIITFGLQAFETIANDECVDRETITVTTTEVLEYTLNTAQTSESMNTSCEFETIDNLDAWYEFVMPVTGNLRVTEIPSNIGITVFDSCGGSELACFFNDGFAYGLVGGTTYVLRVSESQTSAGTISFGLQAFEIALNDDCTASTTITVTTTEVTTYSINTAQATESLNANCDFETLDNLDVWFDFMMPVDGNVRVTNIPNSIGITVFDSCGGNEVACFFNDGFIYNLIANTNYLLRVSESQVSAGDVDFSLQAFEAALNDECTSPSVFEVLEETTSIIPADNRGASESLNASCDFASLINQDIWYEFSMPVNGTLEITNVANSEGFSLYESCTGEELGCFYNDGSFFELINGSTYLLRVTTSSGSANLFDFTVQAVSVDPQPCTDSTIWNGNSWSNGVPDNTKSALFNGNYNTNFDPENINACSVTIANNVTVTIGEGFFLRSVFDITTEGTLNVAHGASIVQVDDNAITVNNGTINVAKTTPILQARDFIVLASPMSQEVNGDVYANADRVFSILEDNFIPNTDPAIGAVVANFLDDNGDYLDNLEIDNPNIPDDVSGTDIALLPGNGYLVFPQAITDVGGLEYSHTYSLGTLNSGTITRATTYNGPATENNFNLLGNPYASAIDVNQFIENNDPINQVYYWEHITPPSADLPGFNTQNFSMDDVSVRNLTGGIASVNGGTTPGQFMASGQGFAVLADQAFTGTDISFNNSMRVTGGNATLRSQEEENESNRIWLILESTAHSAAARTLIGFVPEATASFDLGYDSDRLDTSVNLFSVLENNRQLSIQGRESFNPDMEIALGISSKLSENLEMTLSISQLEGTALGQTDVYLIDALLNTITNLKEGGYTFTTPEGIFDTRFTLVFREQALGVDEDRFRESTISLFPNPASNQVTLTYAGEEQLRTIRIVSTNGRVVKEIVLDNFDKQLQLDLNGLSTGMYFVQIESVQATQIKKLIIK